jgi:hypothetical protein
LRLNALVAVLAILPLAGCSFSPIATPTPAPTIRTEGQGVKCPGGDHGIEEVQFGWSWCYPSTWKFQERLQPTLPKTLPVGVDATFDIVNDIPQGQPGSGDFGFLIVGTYQVGTASDLPAWVTANIGGDEQLTSIGWGNAKDAQQDTQGRRFALTGSHVIEMDVRGTAISAEMGKRLATWKFD